MELFIKYGIFSFLIAAVLGRSVWHERNVANSSEAESDKSDCDCEWRYLKHYETKGCRVEQENECGCPIKYICPSNQSTEDEPKVCRYQNKDYSIGAKIITSEACQVCRCREDDNGVPHISCLSRECPPLDVPKDRNCHLIYREGKCCPTGHECVSEDIEETPASKLCEYNGRLYPYGAKIYPIDDPCQICECNENWRGVSNSSCYQQECIFEKNKAALDAGCIPIYHENKCCPIEFYCSSSHNIGYSSFENNGTTEETFAESGNQCIFAGQFYETGTELSINSTCVKCQCQTPPDFTCVHQSCPPPPNGDCFAHYNSEQCCPYYECLLGDEETIREIDESNIEDGCPTPLCADASCVIKTPPGEQCPTCVCRLTPLPDQSTLQLNQQQLQETETERFFEDNANDFDEYLVEMEKMTKDASEPSDSEYSEVAEGNNAETMAENEEMYYNENNQSTENDEVTDFENNPRLENEVSEKLEKDSSPKTESEDSKELNEQFIPEAERENIIKMENENEVIEYRTEANSEHANQLEKIIQKRSENTEVNSVDAAVVSNSVSVTSSVPQQDVLQQGQVVSQQHELNEDIEREGGPVKENDDDFDAELESLKRPESDQKIDNKITVSGQENGGEFTTEYVPDGCPTPICADSTCRIMIPPGHQCPTCVCKGEYDRQP